MKLSVVVAAIGKIRDISARWVTGVSFAIVFYCCCPAHTLDSRLLDEALEMVMLDGSINWGGIIFYVVLYMGRLERHLFYLHQLQLIKEKTISESVTWQWIEPGTLGDQ